jgi:hypothetical protein
MADLDRRPHPLLDRLSQPNDGCAQLAVGIFHVPARRAFDHRIAPLNSFDPLVAPPSEDAKQIPERTSKPSPNYRLHLDALGLSK